MTHKTRIQTNTHISHFTAPSTFHVVHALSCHAEHQRRTLVLEFLSKLPTVAKEEDDIAQDIALPEAG